MLQLFRKKEPATKRRLDILLNCNQPPSDEERQAFTAHFEELKAAYERACGAPYSPTGPFPKRGRKYLDAIRRCQRVLSPIRNAPPEIWHTIFKYAVLGIEQAHSQSLMLGKLRLVSQHWNSTACTCPVLWCNLPLIDFSTMAAPDLTNYSASAHRGLQYYLQRSRKLPISFTFHFWRDPDSDRMPLQSQALGWVRVLAQESHRWNVVEFRATRAILDALSARVKPGRLSQLSRFVFEMRGTDVAPAFSTISVDFLSNAPRLRHVEFDSLGLGQGVRNEYYDDTVFNVALPWEQLETFKGAVQRCQAYPLLMETSVDLSTLKYTSNNTETLPSASTSLSRLTKLSLCFNSALPTESLISHLRCLTLPSLKELEIYWWGSFDVDLYGTVLALIRRSGCGIERLATEHNLNYHTHAQTNRFKEVLYHCAALTHLDIAYLGGSELGVLIPDTNRAKKPPLPNLRVLTVRYPVNEAQAQMDPVPLIDVLHSRTDLVRKIPSVRYLQDVYVKHDDQDQWRAALLGLGNEVDTKLIRTPFEPLLYTVAQRWKMELIGESSIPSALAEMEVFGPRGRDTRIFVVSTLWSDISQFVGQLTFVTLPTVAWYSDPACVNRSRQGRQDTFSQPPSFYLPNPSRGNSCKVEASFARGFPVIVLSMVLRQERYVQGEIHWGGGS